MPERRITGEELQFIRDMHDPVFVYEFIYGYRCPTYMGNIMRCLALDIEWSAAPATLKSTAIVTDVIMNGLVGVGAHGRRFRDLVSAPTETQLNVTWQECLDRFEEHPWLEEFLRGGSKKGGIQKDPAWAIHWFNGNRTEFRISGRKGDQFTGLHVDAIKVDEAQGFPLAAVTILDTRGNPGCQRRVYGMVDGNYNGYLYKAHKDDTFKHFRTKRYESPTWDERERRRLLAQWGQHSPEWAWFVEADWNMRSEAPFDLHLVSESMRLREQYEPMEFTVEQFRDNYGSDPDAMLAELPDYPRPIVISSDIGETASPTNIMITSLECGGKDRVQIRLALHRFEAYERSKVFAELIKRFDPVAVAIDQGNAGSAVISNLLNPELFPELQGRIERIIMPVSFGSKVDVAVIPIDIPDEEQDFVGYYSSRAKDERKAEKPQIVTMMVKEASTKWLRDMFFERAISLPHDAEVWREFEIHKRVGKRYTDPQHTIDTLRAFAYARWRLEKQAAVGVEATVQQEAPLVFPEWVDAPFGGAGRSGSRWI